MKEILEKLKDFRLVRNIDASQGYKFVLNKQVGFMVSEASEYLDAENEHDQVDGICDICVFAINAHALISEDFSELFTDGKELRNIQIANILDRFPYFFRKYIPIDIIKLLFIEIIEFCASMLIDMGYDFEKSMLETIKEISSRKQDPVQNIEWQHNGASGKWQKDKQQDCSTIYEANYGLCKL